MTLIDETAGHAPDAGAAPLSASERDELAAYREGAAAIAAVCARIAAGDLEARVPPVAGPLEVLRRQVNHLADVADAFVRESSAALAAAGEHRFHRRFLVQGMPGAFRRGAEWAEETRAAMEEAVRAKEADEARQGELVAQVLATASEVAAASNEFGASAERLAAGAAGAVEATRSAIGTVESLADSSVAIGRAAEFIRSVADQTRLLSLNATIEAAHAGEAGRGFNVVANEIRSLAVEVARSSQDIGDNIERTQDAAAGTVEAITGISTLISDMHRQIEAVARAAGTGDQGTSGLADLAEHLRAEISRFAATT